MNQNGRGIKSGLGTCTCDDELRCACGPGAFQQQENGVPDAREERPKKSRDRKNSDPVSGARKGKSRRDA